MLVLLIVLASVAAALLWWMRWRKQNRRWIELGNQIPGPKALPIIGNALQFLSARKETLNAMSKEYGDCLRFWIGPELYVVVKNPADIRAILTGSSASHKGPVYEIMKPLIGPGILTGGEGWRQHRKLAQPSYTNRCVGTYSRVFNKEADLLAAQLMTKDPKETFNVYIDVVASTTQCVCQTLMGLTKEESLNVRSMEENVRDGQKMYTLFYTKMTKWWHQIPLIFWLIGGAAKEKEIKWRIEDMVSDIVTKREKALRAQNITSLKDGDQNSMGVVDRFMLSGLMNRQEIYDETITLFTTSQEAGAKILAGVLLCLAHLPEWQGKVYEEIVEVLGPEDSYVSNDDVKKLRMLEVVFKEVLRFLSIAVVLERQTDSEITLSYGKYTIPTGASVVIPLHDFHRDPRYWDEPDKVKPERFLPENCKKREPYTFVPFSLGQMDCLGRVYATAMIKILAVKVLRKVELEADGLMEDLALHMAISVSVAKGYNLRVKPRSKKP